MQHDLGQLLILGVDELRWDSALERSLRSLRPGGVLINATLTGGAGKVSEFLFKVASTLSAVPLLAVREEGGAMDPLGTFLPPLPSPRAVAKTGIAAVRRLGELVGGALQLLGFNSDFALLLDLATPGSDQAERAFSPDPQQVAKCGAAFVEGLERHHVLACGKHFPGLAGVQSSSATEAPVVSKSMAELWRQDLVPYRTLLPHLPLVLVSTAAYKAYDFDLLLSAGLSSKVVEGLLRVKLGYDGVAIAYGLETEAVRGTLTLEEAAVQAVCAQCDMLLVQEAGAAERALAALCAARESGKLPIPRVEQALERIPSAKKGLKPPAGKLSRRSLDRLVRKFTNFSNDFRGCGKIGNANSELQVTTPR